jgi:hypothetical protein
MGLWLKLVDVRFVPPQPTGSRVPVSVRQREGVSWKSASRYRPVTQALLDAGRDFD